MNCVKRDFTFCTLLVIMFIYKPLSAGSVPIWCKFQLKSVCRDDVETNNSIPRTCSVIKTGLQRVYCMNHRENQTHDHSLMNHFINLQEISKI